MKILYFGGQKSGKSNLAEAKTLKIASNKPYYVATYDNSYEDKQMQERVLKHQEYRKESFITIEEYTDLRKVIKQGETYIVDCISMWLFNNLQKSQETILQQLDDISKIDANIVFVLNEVTSGVIPFDKESRKYVDLTGLIGQKLTSFCNEVYEVKFGLSSRLK